MGSGGKPASAGARIISSSFDVSLLAEHARCHTCAEYLAEVASTAGADSALTARELSACLFELLELARSHHGPGRVELALVAQPDGVEIRGVVPADGALAARYAEWLTPDPGRPADGPVGGLVELVELHHARVSRFEVAGGVGVSIRVPVQRAGAAAEGAPEEATDGE